REAREFVFHSQSPVVLPRSVAEAFEFAAVDGEHLPQLGGRGRGLANGDLLEVEPLVAQPFRGFATGVAFGVGVEFHREKSWHKKGATRATPFPGRSARFPDQRSAGPVTPPVNFLSSASWPVRTWAL